MGIGEDLDRHALRALEARSEVAKRPVELAVGRRPGPKGEDVVAKIPDHAVDVLHGLRDPMFHRRGVVEPPERRLERHPLCEERLDHVVVELFGDPLPILHQSEALQLVGDPGVLERDCSLGSERRNDLDVFLRERWIDLVIAYRQRPECATAYCQRYEDRCADLSQMNQRLVNAVVQRDIIEFYGGSAAHDVTRD